MKYCKNCGKKITDDMNYCEHCGHKIKKDVDIFKIVLLVGVFVVLFSSFAFGIVSWNSMSDLFRLLFFAFESILFFILSLALKSVSRNTSRVFFIIGLILSTFTLRLIPYYGLISEYFRSGAGLYIYLAIIYLFSTIAYFLVNIKFKSNLVNYLALITLLFAFISASQIFVSSLALLSLFIVCYIIILNVLSKLNIFSDKFKKVLSNFSVVFGLIYTPALLITFSIVDEISTFVNIITFVLYSVDSFFKISCNKKSVLRGFNPFTLSSLSLVLIFANLNNYVNICIFTITITFVLLFFISLLFKSKLYSNASLVFTYLAFLLVIIIGFVSNSYLSLFICTIIMLVFNILLIIILKYNFAHFIIPIIIVFAVLSLCNAFFNINGLSIVTLLMILYLISYLLFKLFNNKYNVIYIIFALGFGFISLAFINDISLLSIVTLSLILITFVLSFVFKENNAIRIISYIILNLAIMIALNNFYYACLLIGGVTIALSLIFNKITKFNLKPYMLYSTIIIFLVTLCNEFNYPLVFLGLNAIVFALSFTVVLKYFNISFYRVIYIMLGFLLINRFMILLFNVMFISSLITILLVVIILIVLYLLDKEKSVLLITESLVLLIPYFGIINYHFDTIYELYLVPLIIYTIAYTTIIKERDLKNILAIVFLSIIAGIMLLMNEGYISIIFDVIYALVFIVLGLVRKFNLMIYFGIGLLVLATFFHLFTVLNSLAIVITLLLIGFILIGISVFLQVNKNKKNNS